MANRVHCITQDDEPEELTMAPPPVPTPTVDSKKTLKQLNIFGDFVTDTEVSPTPSSRKIKVKEHTKNGVRVKAHKRKISASPHGRFKKSDAQIRRERYENSEDFKKSHKLAHKLHFEDRMAYLKERKESKK